MFAHSFYAFHDHFKHAVPSRIIHLELDLGYNPSEGFKKSLPLNFAVGTVDRCFTDRFEKFL